MKRQSSNWKGDVEVIRRILISEWDPIGCGVPEDEYDNYIPVIYRLMQVPVGVADLAIHLAQLETEQMGLPARPDVNRRVAKLLLDSME
jgi:hypothetical protein